MIEFQLAGTDEKIPPNFIFETKLDGTRIAALKSGNSVTLINRRNVNKTSQYPEIVTELKKLSFDCLLDGEITADDFFQLLRRDKTIDPLKMKILQKTVPVQYHIFDLLEIDGKNLRNSALSERKRILEQNIQENKTIKIVRAEPIETLQEKMEQDKIEGFIAKNPDAPYIGRRTKDWLKVKRERTADAWIIGYTETDKASRDFRSLIIRLENGSEHHVSSGLTHDLISKLHKEMNALPYSAFKQDGFLCHYLEKPLYKIECSYYPDNKTEYRFPKFLRLKEHE